MSTPALLSPLRLARRLHAWLSAEHEPAASPRVELDPDEVERVWSTITDLDAARELQRRLAGKARAHEGWP